HGAGLGVLAVGTNIPAPVRAFLDAARANRDGMRTVFAGLGQRVVLWRMVHTTASQVLNQWSALDQWRRQIGQPPLPAIDGQAFLERYLAINGQITKDLLAAVNSELSLRRTGRTNIQNPP